MQHQTGVDTTTHMLGEILYSSLRVIHIPLVRDKISFRAGTFDNSLSIRALILILKDLDLAAQKKLILDQTGNTNPKKEDLNEKSFLPLCTSGSSYNID